jgi:hypothetical protein
MKTLVGAATSITTLWGLAAFTIAALFGYLTKKQTGKVPAIARVGIAAIVIVGLTPIIASLYVANRKNELAAEAARNKFSQEALYRLRVTVVDPGGSPADGAVVTCSLGGEPKRVAGGWEFDIPAASKPADGKLTVFASVPSAFQLGRADVVLAADYNPNVQVPLARDAGARLRGIIVDQSGRAVPGARVGIVGYGKEAVITQADGGFDLPAHAGEGQQVEVHFEKGRRAVNRWQLAGDSPVRLVLE